jgi:4-hydroxythreonine-4-phosphate dehydrogenase
MTKKPQPRAIITMGDPSGIGPEIAVKSLSNPEIYRYCKPILIGDLLILEKTAQQLNCDVEFKSLASPRSVKGEAGSIEVIDLKNVDLNTITIGRISADAGRASIEYIEKAVDFCLKGEGETLVTAPINKQALKLARSDYIGHTEILAALCGVKEVLTAFCVRDLKIFFLSRHLPLKAALKIVRRERIIEKTIRIAKALNKIGMRDPRIAIAALNPHASDGGLIGSEEENEIAPAVTALRKTGIEVYGPVPADSVFHQGIEGRYDAVLSMYHDQGHIAAKTFEYHKSVTVTLELPFIRTSVDHGTAHDIAGKGVANSRSLERAIILAAKLAPLKDRIR